MLVILGAHSPLAVLLTSSTREDQVATALPGGGASLGKKKADLSGPFPPSMNRCFCFGGELTCERSDQC